MSYLHLDLIFVPINISQHNSGQNHPNDKHYNINLLLRHSASSIIRHHVREIHFEYACQAQECWRLKTKQTTGVSVYTVLLILLINLNGIVSNSFGR